MKLLHLVLATICVMPCASGIISAEEQWPLFRGDAASTGATTTALPNDLKLLWQHQVDEGAFEGTATIAGGRVYVADLDGTLISLDANNGELLWEFRTEIGFATAPAYHKEKLYLGDFDGIFYCVNAADGKEAWRFTANAEIDSSANFFEGQVLVGSQDATLYCLESESGKVVWKHEIDDQIRCTPSLTDGHAFVAGCDAQLHIIRLSDGNSVGTVAIDGPTGVTPAAEGSRVYFGTESGTFFAIDWQQQDVDWTFRPSDGGQSFRSAPAIGDKLVIAPARNKTMYAWNKADGKVAWQFKARKRIESSPVIAGDRVYFGSNDGRIYALDLETGEERWQYETGGALIASPAIADGKLVISSDDGIVYCFGKK